MKGILMILSLLFLTACGAQEMAAGEAAVERDMVGVTESAPEEAAEAPAEAPAEEVLETAPKSAVISPPA